MSPEQILPLAASLLGAILVGYALGSIPSGLIVGRLLRGVDLRQYGSGRTGTTNALRILGWRASAVVLVADIAKAVVPVYVLAQPLDSPALAAAAALGALVGHNWPVFAGFRGGRGVAVGFGSLLIMMPLAALVALAVFVLLCALTRYVSAGSVAATVAAFLAAVVLAVLGLTTSFYLYYAAAAAVLIVVQHRDNLVRLWKGTERKLGESVRIEGQA
ncbi:MAG: glycerol-3-phosphate 1-O-acyltransferase [Chloroflexota bacterium]|nr:MAG: glycerol-3-phosphate 1-O-acyltransferase [Chloroflexota bacterium]